MFRLRDGACAVFMAPGTPDRVGMIDGGPFVLVPPPLRELLGRVAQGVATDDDAASADGQLLVELGAAADGLPPDDPHIVGALRDLGARIAWRVRHRRERELTDVIRRIHARRKLFVDAWGQTSCLPESAVARIALAKERFGEGARVLLIGDDDFLSTPLALAGFDVTVCDIDPGLITFLRAVANEHGVKVDVRHQDLLRPLPDELVGRFDAVITDPMSHENCLSVFLGRGLAALRPGGRVLSALHPLARRVMRDVLATLPARVVHYDQQVSGYYTTGFQDVDYVSDMVTLERTGGALPVPADAPMPDIDVTVETLPTPPHGFTRILGMRLGGVPATLDRVRDALVGQGVSIAHLSSVEEGRFLHVRAVLDDGSALTIVLDRRRFTGTIHTFPYDEQTALPAVAAVDVLLRRQGKDHFFPYVDHAAALTPIVDGR